MTSLIRLPLLRSTPFVQLTSIAPSSGPISATCCAVVRIAPEGTTNRIRPQPLIDAAMSSLARSECGSSTPGQVAGVQVLRIDLRDGLPVPRPQRDVDATFREGGRQGGAPAPPTDDTCSLDHDSFSCLLALPKRLSVPARNLAMLRRCRQTPNTATRTASPRSGSS